MSDSSNAGGRRPTVGSIHTFAGIDWRVLAVEDDKALLISDEILEMRPYHDKYEKTTWEHCTLRKYLNGEFLNKLGAMKSAIADTHNPNPDNPWYDRGGGNATTDKVFLLSFDEVRRYFGDSTAELTDDWYYEDSPNRMADYGSKGPNYWWLRTPGCYNGPDVAYVGMFGSVNIDGDCTYLACGVRPALWLNL